MAFKLINATEARVGTVIMIEEEPCIVKKIETSKTGKHGHAKVRIEAIGIFDNKKRIFVVPGHERFEVPLINKSKGQVLVVKEIKASVMDLESYETLDVDVARDVEGLKEGDNVEYWSIEGRKIIKRKL